MKPFLTALIAMLALPAFAQLEAPAFRIEGETVRVQETIVVKAGKTFDGRLPDGRWTRYVAHPKKLGSGSQKEGQKPLFLLMPGATLKHVILDKPSADGIHVVTARGKTTRIRGIQIRDVGEDAITIMKGSDKGTVLIDDCAFLKATDKVIQINGTATVIIDNCYAQNFGRFVRTNGDGPNLPYRVEIDDLKARNGQSILKMSNSKARATVSDVLYTNVDDVTTLSRGAKASVRNVEKIGKHKGFFRKIFASF